MSTSNPSGTPAPNSSWGEREKESLCLPYNESLATHTHTHTHTSCGRHACKQAQIFYIFLYIFFNQEYDREELNVNSSQTSQSFPQSALCFCTSVYVRTLFHTAAGLVRSGGTSNVYAACTELGMAFAFRGVQVLALYTLTWTSA